MTDGFLDEFGSFVEFLGNLWGILAGVSALFPLSNLLFDVVPTDPEVLWALAYIVDPEGLLTTVATVGSLFVILWTFGQRYRFEGWRRRRVQRRAWLTFGVAVVLLVVYLLLYAIAASGGEAVIVGPAGSSSDLVFVLYQLAMLLVYAGFFALTTRAFVLLGLIEFAGIPE
jgi:hypothetical protein